MVEEAGKPVTSLEEIFSQLEVNGRFRNLQLDYQAPFQLIKKNLRRGLKEGKEAVALVSFNQLGLPILEPSSLVEMEILLGKRARRKEKPWGETTWAPMMETIEERDIDSGDQKAKARAKDKREFTYGDFIEEIAYRGRFEESKRTPTQVSVIRAKPFKDSKTGWTIHVVVEVIQAVSQKGRRSEEWQLLEGKKTIKAEPDSGENTEFKWFSLGNLPLNEMEPGTKKAIRMALDVLAEKKYIIVQR